MVHIKKFVDRVASMEGRHGKDVVLPIAEARALRDEITKLLADKVNENPRQSTDEITIEVRTGKW